MVTGREWELNLRHHGNGIGNEMMGMGMLQAIPAHLYSLLLTALGVLRMLPVLQRLGDAYDF